jgi:hypothetical protein
LDAVRVHIVGERKKGKDHKMPDPLEPREQSALRLLIEFAGPKRMIHYSELRKAGFPERLNAIYKSKSEYLDSLANRKFQILEKRGWIALDKTSRIEILHRL